VLRRLTPRAPLSVVFGVAVWFTFVRDCFIARDSLLWLASYVWLFERRGSCFLGECRCLDTCYTSLVEVADYLYLVFVVKVRVGGSVGWCARVDLLILSWGRCFAPIVGGGESPYLRGCPFGRKFRSGVLGLFLVCPVLGPVSNFHMGCGRCVFSPYSPV